MIINGANTSNNSSLSNVNLLQPRPETLAVLSKDSFAEKYARTPSLLKSDKEPERKEQKNNEGQQQQQQQQPSEKAPAQIPFIEDDYDEVCFKFLFSMQHILKK